MIKIDIDTRCWQIPKEECFLGVESDDKVKILQFELSKNEFYDGLNFTDCNCFINYKNEDNDTIPYGITDMKVQEDGTVTFTWEVSRGATIFKGNTFAVLCAKKVREDGTITNEWNSRIGSFIVAKGLEPSSSITEVPEIDIISQLLLLAQQTNASAQTNINQSSQLLEKAEGLGYLKEEYDVLESRMNQFTSLKEGSTTGDAELADIRVGADGKTYETAGDAVRGQISELKGDLNEFNDYLETKKCYMNFSSFGEDNKYYDASLVQKNPEDGNQYRIAQPFKLKKGTYKFNEINTYWTFYKTSNGTITRLGSATDNVYAFNEDVEIYCTITILTSSDYQNVYCVDGENTPTSTEIGIFHTKYDDLVDKVGTLANSFVDSKNLYDGVGYESKYIKEDGSMGNHSSMSTSPYISIDKKYLVFTENGVLRTPYACVLYDENKTTTTIYHTKKSNISSILETSNTDKYFRFTEYNSLLADKYMVESNDTGEKSVYIPADEKILKNECLQFDLDGLSPKINYTFSLFNNACACGDSFTQGACADETGAFRQTSRPWFDKIMKKYGLEYLNAGIGGSSTRTWITNANGLQKVLSEKPYELYTLAWGINDLYGIGSSYLGTIEDITDNHENNPDTFYGNYARIIEQIKNHAPNAKMIMFPIWYYYPDTESVQSFNNAIKEIANHYSVMYLDIFKDSFFCGSDGYVMVQGHPTSLGYTGMANAIERLFNDLVADNISYFLNTGF